MGLRIAIPATVVVLALLWASVFTVDVTETAVVTQFGSPVAVVTEPGLRTKIPLAQQVRRFDARLQVLEPQQAEFLTKDKKNVVVNYFAVWRIADPLQYEHLHRWQFLNQFMSVCAFSLFLSQILFFVNVIRSLAVGEKAGRNPWHANTLEWSTTSPAPHGNFGEEIPTVHHGPYEYASPDVAEDYLPQWRELEPKTA